MEKEAKFEWAALTGFEQTVYAVFCEHQTAMNAMEIYYLTAEDMIDQNRNYNAAQKYDEELKKLEVLDNKYFIQVLHNKYIKHKSLSSYPRAEAEKILKEYRKVCNYVGIPVFTTIIKVLEDGVKVGWIKKRTISTGRASGVYYLPEEIKTLVKPMRIDALGHD